MKILINTDKTIVGDKGHQDIYSELIEKKLSRFRSHITRIEAHFSDQNGKKEGYNNILCTLEARIEGRQAIAVSDQADTTSHALSGAIDKLKASLETHTSTH